MTQKFQIEVVNSFNNIIMISNFCLSKGYTIVDLDGMDDIYFENIKTTKQMGLHFNGAELTISIDENDLSKAIVFPNELNVFIKYNCTEEKDDGNL